MWQKKQRDSYRLQDVLQRQVYLGRAIIGTGWNPTPDMKDEFRGLVEEYDLVHQEFEAASADCDGPVAAWNIR
ncbi:hypothetical protein [Burkholderia glumae]